MNKRLLQGLMSLQLLCSSMLLHAAGVDVLGVRMWQAPDNTRLVFDLSAAVEHKLFTLSNPSRIVLDLDNASLSGRLPALAGAEQLLSGVRTGQRKGNDLRIVLDMKEAVRPKSFLLKPNDTYGHRLVIDLFPQTEKSATAPVSSATSTADPSTAVTPKTSPEIKQRQIIVAIDAGHGGDDPGAKGRSGTYEKDVVLEVAKKLEAMVNSEPGMRAVLTRSGDYFLSLRKRIDIARQNRADMFISIHADAFHDPRAHGSSVYALSKRGASSEAAKWLANTENQSDLIGGVSLDDKDDLLASVLLDLSQTATIEASLDIGSSILGGLKQIGKVHKSRVQQAGFVVLKSPDIPSVLVETAFISNPTEEKRLLSSQYQTKMAQAMMHGIRNYFSKFPPEGTQLARQHKIQSGDTLSDIAARYQVPLQQLRLVNQLSNDKLIVGRTLTIPQIDS